MTKHTVNYTTVEIETIDGQIVIDMRVDKRDREEWCTLLDLLSEDLAERFKVDCKELAYSLEFYRGELPCDVRVRGRTIEIGLSKSMVDRARVFLLKYYRDGFASVDHLDFEWGPSDANYFTLRVDDFAPPISAEELAKLIG